MDRRTTRQLMERLVRDAERIAGHFGLEYKGIEPERPNIRSRYGVCDSDGLIKIRLRHAVTGRPLKYSSLVNTLCHELAHLRHFNHGERFRGFYLELLAHARRAGIYKPGPSAARVRPVGTSVAPLAPAPARTPRPARPEQLTLFS